MHEGYYYYIKDGVCSRISLISTVMKKNEASRLLQLLVPNLSHD